VLSGPPLKIEKSIHSTWFVFTDRACDQEAKKGSIGGVLYNPSGDCLHFFGESVTPRLMEDLFSRFQNPIHELELLPVLVASFLWVEMFQYSQARRWSIS
jgi:hypothetical protein